MALSLNSINALKVLKPSSLKDFTLLFFEFMKYDTEDIRTEAIISKKEIVERFLKSERRDKKLKKELVAKELEKFTEVLEKIGLTKNNQETIEECRWEKIIEICDLLRKIERSDEKKVRWTILYLYGKGKNKISQGEIKQTLSDFDIRNLDRAITKIIKTEYAVGLDASFENEMITINHELSDKIVEHYFGDDIGEQTRRSPGEIENEILDLLDEGSYSNLEISKILDIDEAVTSRIMTKLRNQNKLVLSSLGNKGFRYYTTNCENCPFGMTIPSCRKESLAYIINSFSVDYGMDLSSKDFEKIESNQALLQIKRILMMAKKDYGTVLERNAFSNLETLLAKVVDSSIGVDSKGSAYVPSEFAKVINNLPIVYQIGLKKGSTIGANLVEAHLNNVLSSYKQKDRDEIKKKIKEDMNKFLQVFARSSNHQ